MRRRALARFALEAAFLVLVAVVTGLAALGPVAIVVVMVAALGLVTAFERLMVRAQVREVALAPAGAAPEVEEKRRPVSSAVETPEWLESAAILGVHVVSAEPETVEEVVEVPEGPVPEPAEAEGEPVPEPEPAAEVTEEPAAPEPEPRAWPAEPRRRAWRRGRREAADRKRPARTSARSEEQPVRPEVESEPAERLCRTCGRPISAERLRAIPTATQCIECKRSGDPEVVEPAEVEAPAAERGLTADLAVESEREAERAAPALPPSPLADAREWNVWELERLARRFGGKDLNQDEEWGFLLVYLREFATPEGLLPADFDALVRESFPELVAAVETS